MHQGSCLCRAVQIEVSGELEHAPEACHCSQCRKQSGHFLAAVNVRRTALRVTGAEHVRWYAATPDVDRGFCAVCGSTLFWRPTRDGYLWTAVAMGVFDGPTGARIGKHTFVSDKGDYYDIDDGAPRSEGH